MLLSNPSQRLSNLSKIKKHCWFKNFSWKNLSTLSIAPPYLPVIKTNDELTDNHLLYLDFLKTQKRFCPKEEPKKKIKEALTYDSLLKYF
jgi:hypothetical protein